MTIKELLELSLIFTVGCPHAGISLKIPRVIHHAMWMKIKIFFINIFILYSN